MLLGKNGTSLASVCSRYTSRKQDRMVDHVGSRAWSACAAECFMRKAGRYPSIAGKDLGYNSFGSVAYQKEGFFVQLSDSHLNG